MIQLVYTSKAQEGLSRDDIESIINLSLKNNKKNNINSILIYSGTHFLQLLEGEENIVNITYLKIKNDNRNINNTVIYKKPILKQYFPKYKIEFRNTEQTTLESIVILCLRDTNDFIKKLDFMTLASNNLKFNPERLIFFNKINTDLPMNSDSFFEFANTVSPNAIMLIDSNSQIIYANQASCKMLGYTNAELLNLCLCDIDVMFPKKIWPSFYTDFVKNKNIHYQSQHRKKTGDVFPVDIKSHLYKKNKQNYILSFINDITQKYKIEKELLEHKVNLENIIQTQPADLNNIIQELKLHKTLLDKHSGVSITDPEGIITYVNDEFCKISGYSRQELIGKNHRILKSAKHHSNFYKNMYNSLLKNKIWKGEICNKTKNGNLSWVEATMIAQMDDNNRPLNFFSIRTDITDKKNYALTVKETAEKLKTILHNASDGIHIVDQNGNITDCSLSFAKSLGYQKEEALNLKIWDIDLEINIAKLKERFNDYIENIHTIQSRYKTKENKYIDVEIAIKCIKLHKEKLLFCSSRNITLRLESQKKIETLANTDYLTGLANRLKFMHDFENEISIAKNQRSSLVLAYIDIDKFKLINDKYGHNIGDEVLKIMGRILSHNCRKTDIVARIGGDEFTVILKNSNIERATDFQNKIKSDYNRIIKINDQKIEIKYSVGLAIYPIDADNIEDLLQKADENLYIAKKSDN